MLDRKFAFYPTREAVFTLIRVGGEEISGTTLLILYITQFYSAFLRLQEKSYYSVVERERPEAALY